MTTIYQLLERDHTKAKQVLREFVRGEGSPESLKKELTQLRLELELHMQYEEKEFYPVYLENIGDKDQVRDAQKEHAEARELMVKLAEGEIGSEAWRHTAEELLKALEHHIKDEEEKMFPKAREVFNSSEAQTMAEHYEQMKASVA